MLHALSGHSIDNELIESRMGDILVTSYRPSFFEGNVKAIVLVGKLQQQDRK